MLVSLIFQFAFKVLLERNWCSIFTAIILVGTIHCVTSYELLCNIYTKCPEIKTLNKLKI